MRTTEERSYIAIDLKSFYASVECRERGLDPLDAHLVVADPTRTDKTICLAVSPSLKAYGIPGRARLFEVVQRAEEVNAARRSRAPGRVSGAGLFRQLALRGRAGKRSLARAGLYRGAAAHGLLHGIQHAHL